MFGTILGLFVLIMIAAGLVLMSEHISEYMNNKNQEVDEFVVEPLFKQ